MTLTRLSGAISLRDPLVSQLLGEWVASSPLAKARWYEATEVAQLPVIRKKQIEASVLFPPPELIGSLMDLNVPKGGSQHVSEFMTRRGATHTAATGLPFPRPIPSRDRFMDTWKELVKLLALDRPVSAADPPTRGRSWPLQSWAHYIQLRRPLMNTIEWKRPLTFLLRGDAYLCAGGCWTQLSIGIINHPARGPPPAFLVPKPTIFTAFWDFPSAKKDWHRLEIGLNYLCEHPKLSCISFGKNRFGFLISVNTPQCNRRRSKNNSNYLSGACSGMIGNTRRFFPMLAHVGGFVLDPPPWLSQIHSKHWFLNS